MLKSVPLIFIFLYIVCVGAYLALNMDNNACMEKMQKGSQ